MRIILSRKGFDSANGGYPSPIMPDGRMVSLPIPDQDTDVKYSQLFLPNGKNYGLLMQDLIGPEIKIRKNKFEIDSSCFILIE